MDGIGSTPNLIGSGIENLRNSSLEGTSQSRIEAVGKEFEGVFLSLLLKEMRNTLQDGGFFGSESSDTYGGLFDLYLGKSMAQSSPLGVANMMVEQYARHPNSGNETNVNNQVPDPTTNNKEVIETQKPDHPRFSGAF